MTKQKFMDEFTITEISAVDLPAQAEAKARVIKRNEGAAALKKMDASGIIAKRYLNPVDGAVSFGQVLREELKHEQYYEMMNQVSPYICSMETSLRAIAGDSSVEPLTKLSMMRNTVEDFMSSLRGLWTGSDEFLASVMSKLNDEPSDDGEALFKRTEEVIERANAALIEKTQRALDEKEQRLNEQISEQTKEKVDDMSTDLMTKAKQLASERNIPMHVAMSEARKANPDAYSKHQKKGIEDVKLAKQQLTSKESDSEKAREAFRLKAEEIARTRGISKMAAWTEARKEHPDLFKRLRDPIGSQDYAA